MTNQKSLKISLVSGTLAPMRCGIGDYTTRLAHVLSQQPNITLSVIASRDANAQADFSVYPIATTWGWRDLLPILQTLNELKPDVVHYQYPTAVYKRRLLITFLPVLVTLFSLLKFRRPPRAVATIHEYASFTKIGKIRIWLMALQTTRLIAVSPDTAHALRFLRFLGKRVTVIPLGSNLSDDTPPEYAQNPAEWRTRHNISQSTPVLAYFGFVSPSKGLDTLVEAFGQLQTDAQLLFIAEQPDSNAEFAGYYKKLEELINKSGKGEKIKWTGFAPDPDVAAYLQSATIAVLPFDDGVSTRRTSLVAALLNGTPTISTLPRNSREAPGLAHGENIWLVPPRDPATLADAIEKLLAEAALRPKIGASGQKFARSLDWQVIARQHVEFYQK
jgi:polysaccharide biosynthesis protein PslF